MIVLEREKDGAIFPYSRVTAKKPGFRVVDDADRTPYQGRNAKRKKERPAVPKRMAPVTLEQEFADFDEAALAAHVNEMYHVDFPPEARKEDLLAFIRSKRAAETLAAAGEPPEQDPVKSAASPTTEDAPGADEPDVLKGLTKAQLVERAKTLYGYDMPDMKRDAMIDELKRLESEHKK